MRTRLLCLLLFASCGTERLSSLNSEVSTPVDRLDFGTAIPGHPVTRGLSLENRSRISVTLELNATDPFSHAPTVLVVPGEQELALTFVAPSVGVFEAVLEVGAQRVTLHGEGVAPEQCPAVACRVAEVDPLTGACRAVAAPDGTSCTTGCVSQGTCVSGACEGTARSCDDGDACTLDACSESAGCIHAAVTCEALEDPCLAPACDPVAGCQRAPVADGTPCGPATCSEAHVCLAGACQAVVPPDGFVCAEASPCQAEGRCEAGACVQPPVSVLTPRWARVHDDSVLRPFAAVATPQGEFAWVECGASCTLLSVSAAGVPHLAVPVAQASSKGALVFAAGRFVLATASALFAYDAATGALEWQRALPPDATAVTVELASAPTGRVLWALLAPANTGLREATGDGIVPIPSTTLLLIELSSGVVLRQTSLPQETSGLVVDGLERAWLLEQTVGVVVVDESGPRTALDATHGAPVSLERSTLVLQDDSTFDVGTGALTMGTSSAVLTDSIQVPGRRYRRGALGPSTQGVWFADHFAADLGSFAVGPWATARGLVSAGREAGVVSANLHDAAGRITGQCPLGASGVSPTGRAVYSGAALLLELACVSDDCPAEAPALALFELPGLGLPASGWVAPRGDPGGAGHAL